MHSINHEQEVEKICIEKPAKLAQKKSVKLNQKGGKNWTIKPANEQVVKFSKLLYFVSNEQRQIAFN